MRTLVRPRVEVVRAEARAIAVSARRVETDGRTIGYDHLVVALGAEFAPEAFPGLSEAAHTFYTLEGSERLRVALDSFAGGTVAVVVSALPYKCPGAPHEGAMLMSDFFRRGGLRGKVDLHLFILEPQAMPSTGSACHAGHEQAPAVVLAMNVPARDALGTVRLTLGRGTSEAQVRRAARTLAEA